MKDEKLYIKTIQAFIVFETEKFYQKVVAQKGISHFYSFTCGSKADRQVPILADGCSNLLFEYSSNNINSYFIGNTVKGVNLNLKKNCEYFGIRFEPGVNPFLAKQDVKGLVDQTIPLKDFSIFKDLTEKMAGESTFTTRMCAFMEEYNGYIQKKGIECNSLFLQMITVIVNKNGLIKIKELEKLSGYSNRYINHLFEENLGCSAKQFCTYVKMHSVLKSLNKNKIDSMADFSNKYMFYDQSHFVHTFKDFTGITPSEYIDTVNKEKYGEKVLNLGVDFK